MLHTASSPELFAKWRLISVSCSWIATWIAGVSPCLQAMQFHPLDLLFRTPGRTQPALNESEPVRVGPPDEGNLVTAVVVLHFGHERAHQKQPPVAALLQVRRVGRVRQFR